MFSILGLLGISALTLQSLLFWQQKKRGPPKKKRIFLPAKSLKSLEKRAKTHKRARKTAKLLSVACVPLTLGLKLQSLWTKGKLASA